MLADSISIGTCITGTGMIAGMIEGVVVVALCGVDSIDDVISVGVVCDVGVLFASRAERIKDCSSCMDD